MDEAIRETLEKDMDIPHTKEVLQSIAKQEIQLKVVKTVAGEATPIARIGLERISRKTDLIPTEKLDQILVGSTKARILNEVKTLVCTSCWKYIEMKRVKDIPITPECPECGSKALAALGSSDEDMRKILLKDGTHLSEKEKNVLARAEEISKLVNKYGRLAVYTLAGRRVTPIAAQEILRKHKKPTTGFFQAIMEAEREALKERFW